MRKSVTKRTPTSARKRKPPTPTPAPGPRPKGPIHHVVIIVKENHAFDTYFGRFPGADGDPILAFASAPPSSDHPHTHAAWLNRANIAAKEQYAQANIPNYWRYAQQYTLCDKYFTEVAGPSTPNHLMLIAADSPIINNPHYRDPINTQPPFNIPSLPAALEKAGLTWGNYGGCAPGDITPPKRDKRNTTPATIAPAPAPGKTPTVSSGLRAARLRGQPVRA